VGRQTTPIFTCIKFVGQQFSGERVILPRESRGPRRGELQCGDIAPGRDADTEVRADCS